MTTCRPFPLRAFAFSLTVLTASTAALAAEEPPPPPASGTVAESPPSPTPVPSEPLPLDDLRIFTEVYAKIKTDYVEGLTDKKLIENSIRGLLSGLDPHSAYLNPDEFRNLQEGTSGEFGGLGLEMGMENGVLTVIAPIDDTPAQKAGIQSGDIIIRINDAPTKGLSMDEAVNLMRGRPGSELTLGIIRSGSDEPLQITLKRDVIKIASVKGNTLEPGYVYLRVAHFQEHTGQDLYKALDKLSRENQNAIKGLILDLRNNPGGILNAGVEVCDAFMDSGRIVYTEGRVKDSQLAFDAKPGDKLNGAPMIVLVNGGSASASEIVAGALQDSQRAVIMGAQTFGKGSVQTILPMNNGAAVKLTTARYFTPKGRSIQAAGIIPDIPLRQVRLADAEASNVKEVKESDLSGHLSNGNADGSGGGKPSSAPNTVSEAQRQDYDIQEALNLLKGMVLLRGRNQG